MTSSLKWVFRIVGGLLGLLLFLLVAAQIVLSPKLCTKIVNRYAPALIDGDFSLKTVSVSLFSHFPAVTFNAEDLVLVYPAERFDSLRRSGLQSYLLYAGACRQRNDSSVVAMDTLASFRRFSLAVNVLSFIDGREIDVKDLRLTHPRVYLHDYDSLHSNIDVLPFLRPMLHPERYDEEELSAMPNIRLRRIFMGDRASVVYTRSLDTLNTMLYLEDASFKGVLSTVDVSQNDYRLNLDTLLVIGTYKADSLLFNLNHLEINDKRGYVDLDCNAVLNAGTGRYGRARIPISLSGEAVVGDYCDTMSIDVRRLHAAISSVKLDAAMLVRLGDSLYMKGGVKMHPSHIQPLLTDVVSRFWAGASDVRTDAAVSGGVEVDGWFNPATMSLPAFKAHLDVPEFSVSYGDLDVNPRVDLRADVVNDADGMMNASVSRFNVNMSGLDANLTANVRDVMGKDPLVSFNAGVDAVMDTLSNTLSELLSVRAEGNVTASVQASALLSQFTLYRIGSAQLKASASSPRFRLYTDDGKGYASLDKMSLKVDLMDSWYTKSKSSSHRSLGGILDIDSLYFRYADSAMVHGRSLKLMAQGEPHRIKLSDSVYYNPLRGRLSIGRFYFKGVDSLGVMLMNSENNINVCPLKSDPTVPVIEVKSDNKRVMMRKDLHRAFLSGLKLNATARMFKTRGRRIPEANRRQGRVDLKEYYSSITDSEIRKADIKIDLGESFRKYFTTWGLNGTLAFDRLGVATTAFPLRTSVSNFKGSFTNDGVILDTLQVAAGVSRVAMSGSLTNLRRALLRHGLIKTSLYVRSDTVSVTQILGAVSQGFRNAERDLDHLRNADDQAFEEATSVMVSEDLDSLDLPKKKIIIPANLDVSMKVRGKAVSFATISADRISADLNIRESCLQIQNTTVFANAGNIYCDAFVSTRNPVVNLAGFDLRMERMEAEKIIEVIPHIDSLMPMLRSFKGKMNCDIAATAHLDPALNLLIPTMNGVVRFTGSNLRFEDDPQVTRIARLLRFRAPKSARIDTMTVEGVLRDSRFEVFPFMLKVDRWQLAFAGIQNLDKSYNYHMSVVRGPLLVRFGVNVTGSDFDNPRIKLGRTQYRNPELPVFTQYINSTRISLLDAIHDAFQGGVEAAIRRSRDDAALDEARKENNYSHSVALDKLTELSEDETRQVYEN